MRTILGRQPVTLEAGYILLLPEGAPPEGGWPLLLALHGFGFDGSLLRGRLRSLLPAPYAVLLPDGPYPVEMRQASPPRVGRSWYQYTGDQPAFLEALAFTISHLDRLLERVAREHPICTERIAVLGFSQGGYVASFLALRESARFAGLITISCRIKVEALQDELPSLSGFPVLVLHGEGDDLVRLEPQLEAVEVLKRHGVDVELLLHDGGHVLRRDQVGRIDQFTRRVLGV
ncbi:MAG: hypothetical protein V2A76_10200 [Planctomycetota bacterium]